MNLAGIRALYEYNSWANQRTLDACAGLSEAQLDQDLGASYKSVRGTLAHIFGVEWLWLERWHGRSHDGLPALSEYPTFESIRNASSRSGHNLQDFIAGITQHDLNKNYAYKTTRGIDQTSPGWQMFQHLVNHGTYHRGQITSMLRQLGATPQATDLILFYRERNPIAKT